MTNATKALIIAAVNAALTLTVEFGVTLSSTQIAAITAVVNALLALVVALTYKKSPRWNPNP